MELMKQLIIFRQLLCANHTEGKIEAFNQRRRYTYIYMFLLCVCVYYLKENEGKFHQHVRFGTIIIRDNSFENRISFRPPLFLVPNTK